MSAALVPLPDASDMTPAMREVAVSTYLEHAKNWLHTAVEQTGAAEIATAKAEMATTAEATKQLNLSKEIQLDALEMVRRAEFSLGKAIRKGQEEGQIRQRGFVGPQSEYVRNGRPVRGSNRGGDPDQTTISPKALVTSGEELHQVYAMSDGVELDEFETALTEAKAEGNVSRANVVRKVKGKQGPTTRDERAELIEDLAAQGYSSRQMSPKVGVLDSRIREIARAYGIDIPADRVIGKTRRIDWTDAVRQTVIGLENTAEFIGGQVDLAEVDWSEADEWLSSLTNSIRALNRFKQQIKEHSLV
jgi:hypothetical protein